MSEEHPHGFLGRWSRLKNQARENPVEDPAAAERQPVAAVPAAAAQEPEAPAAPLPTLEDVQALTPESDFKLFMATDVAPEVKNAAMKKLFSDPRYNVMDGLDTYIDDYTQRETMPESLLRRLASSKTLNLFPDQEEGEDEGTDVNRQTPAPAAGQIAAPPAVAHADTVETEEVPVVDSHQATQAGDADPMETKAG